MQGRVLKFPMQGGERSNQILAPIPVPFSLSRLHLLLKFLMQGIVSKFPMQGLLLKFLMQGLLSKFPIQGLVSKFPMQGGEHSNQILAPIPPAF